MKKLIELFLTMLKIGTFTFGGGYSMIAFLETFSVDDIKLLFIIKEADLLAQNPKFHYILDEYKELEERLIKLKNI